jgi:serine/threonine-protein kinase
MPRPSHFNPSVPPALDEIVLKATAKSPEERYQRAGEMADDLRSVLASGVDAEAAADSTIIDPTGILRGIELREPIGSGGFGKVYRAYQPSVARDVAVKVILPRFAKHPDFVRRFEKEAQLVARLEHPHIVPLYDYWRHANGAYLVMRLMQNGNLCDALGKGPWDVKAAAHLLDQIAGALDYAHRQGVVHRDVKPENILLDHDGNAYLSDFGIAKDLVDATATTDPDAVPGSLWYISPEQAQSAPVTPQSDLYSLGIVMYEVLTGEHPFSGLTPPDQLIRRLTEPLPPLADRRPGLPAALNEVVQQVTAKDPVERFPDVPTFARAFRLALAGTVVEIADPARHLDVDVDSTGGQRTAIQ